MSSCNPSKFCISLEQARKVLLLIFSTQTVAASCFRPSTVCWAVSKTFGEEISVDWNNKKIISFGQLVIKMKFRPVLFQLFKIFFITDIWFFLQEMTIQWNLSSPLIKAIPMKCFVSHRPPSREGGKTKEWTHEGFWVPVKAGLLSTKAWWRGPFVRNQMVFQEQDYQMSKKATKTKVSMIIQDNWS